MRTLDPGQSLCQLYDQLEIVGSSLRREINEISESSTEDDVRHLQYGKRLWKEITEPHGPKRVRPYSLFWYAAHRGIDSKRLVVKESEIKASSICSSRRPECAPSPFAPIYPLILD